MPSISHKPPVIDTSSPPVSPASHTFERKLSSTSTHSTPSHSGPSPGSSPKVQLVPYARTASFDIPLSDVERQLLDQANFDGADLSSQDFDFEDIFLYDKPQKKLAKVVEVSRPRAERDWANFSFSHYSAAVSARHKVNRARQGIGELYVRNQGEKRKG